MLPSPQDLSLNNKKEALLQMATCQKFGNSKVQGLLSPELGLPGQTACCRTKVEETDFSSLEMMSHPMHIRGILRAS